LFRSRGRGKEETIYFNGKNGNIKLKKGNKSIIILDPVNGNIYVAGNNEHGNIFVYPQSVTNNTDGKKALSLLVETMEI
jgi:DUF4097 and DUF4098 domain-containing protein YvlB